MICTKCGFQNSPGDEFCGNCGTFLEWSGEAESPTEPLAAQPTSETPPAQPSPTDITQPVPTPPITQAAGAAVVCWNCGRQNPVGRSFCQQCGERLEVAAGAGAVAAAGPAGTAVAGAPGGGGGRRTIAIAIGVIALLLLAGGAAAIFMGGLSTEASPTPTSAALPSDDASPSAEPSPSGSASPSAAGSPSGSPSGPTSRPTATASPTQPPTAPPTPTKPPTPAPTPVNCDASTAPDRWLTLTGVDNVQRIRRERAWCVHQIVFVAEEGEGRLKLYLTNEAFLPDYGMATIGWHEAYMPSDFSSGVEYLPDLQTIQPYKLLLPRTDITFEVSCTSPTCSGFVQIGYEQIRAP
jgi:ribosomal protein L40E